MTNGKVPAGNPDEIFILEIGDFSEEFTREELTQIWVDIGETLGAVVETIKEEEIH